MEAIEAAGVPAAAGRAGRAQLIVAIVAGIVGALGAVAAFGKGTVTVTPLVVDVAVTPAVSGTTTLAAEAGALTSTGEAEASTHTSLLAFSATIVGVDAAGLATATLDEGDALNPADPFSVARYLAQNAKDEMRGFGIKVGAIALGGGFALSLLLSFGKWKRAVAGAVAGVVVLGLLALLAQRTYDVKGFVGTQYRPPGTSAP